MAGEAAAAHAGRMDSQTNKGSRVREFFTAGRIAVLVIAAVTLVFIFQNTGQTSIQLLLVEVTMPLWVTLFGTLLIGGVCGYLLRRHGGSRRR